ncbi:MAG: RadC family protein [Phototrophicaceae bacterium]|jgi:DNA repair protein RadC
MSNPPVMMADLPESERPRERLIEQGANSLSNSELLAILLRTGTASENVLRLAERLLVEFGGLHGLAKAKPHELLKFKGLGMAKVAQICAALEIGIRLKSGLPQERLKIQSAEDAMQLVIDMRHLQQETVKLILLDLNGHVHSIPTLYVGTQNASVLRIPEILREVIGRGAAAYIMVHNHPYGAASPSPEDVHLTRDLIAASTLLDVDFVDHLIIGERDWVSLREMRLAFNSPQSFG